MRHKITLDGTSQNNDTHEWAGCVCVCVCVCVREREREKVCVCASKSVCVCVKEREWGVVTDDRHTETKRPILTFHLQHHPFTHLTLTKARIHSYAHKHTLSLTWRSHPRDIL